MYNTDSEEATICDDQRCQKCGKSDQPEWILLCDDCDNGYHCSCLKPVLFIIPEGDWYCPPCQQVINEYIYLYFVLLSEDIAPHIIDSIFYGDIFKYVLHKPLYFIEEYIKSIKF